MTTGVPAVPALPNNYVPGDWNETFAERDSNRAAYGGSASELSTVAPPTQPQEAALPISGDARNWTNQLVSDNVCAPSTVTPDLQGKQASKTPYVNLHLFP